MAEITIRVYTIENGYNSSQTIKLNNGELEEIIGDYISEQYLRDSQDVTGIDIEEFRPY